jgi:hypothetical protein
MREMRTTPAVSLLLATLAGCGDNYSADSTVPVFAEHAYALQTTVYNLDESVSSYVAITDSLALEDVTLDNAREFPGYAFISTIGGHLLVSAGEEPRIDRFDVSAALGWEDAGSISFANFGVGAGGAGFERQWFLDEHTAYLTLEVTRRIVWDPTDFVIDGVVDDTALPAERDGLVLDAVFNRPPEILRGPVLKPFYYRDEDWFQFGPATSIAVYDPETHAEAAILDVPCPALEVASQDEAGNTYFSPWTYGPALALFDVGPAPCVRRIGAGATLDTTWAPDLTTWTDGRHTGVFRYLADGKALGTVLHHDEVEADFTMGYDEDVANELSLHWKLWLFDLATETARPVEGVGATGGGFQWARLDGRTFVFIPNEDWSATTVFEIDPVTAVATARFSVPGLVNNWVKVR